MALRQKPESSSERHHRHDIRMIGVASLLVVVAGVFLWQQGGSWATVGHSVTVFGTASLSVCLTSYFTRRIGENSEERANKRYESHADQIFRLIADCKKPPIMSNDDILDALRIPVYVYHKTIWYDGSYIWRQCKYEFNAVREQRPGFLQARFDAEDRNGNMIHYIVRGYRVGVRLVLIQEQDASGKMELPTVQTFGHAGEGFGEDAGLGWVQTWFGDPICAPVLLTDHPMDGTDPTTTQSTVTSIDVCRTLDETWGDAMRRQDPIDPLAACGMGQRAIVDTPELKPGTATSDQLPISLTGSTE